MIIYILAIPIFSFLLPIYSFWKQDDFSWGQTRVVLGEKGKKLVIHEEGAFDEKEIPLKSWHDYENELWERGSNASIGQILAEKEEAAYMVGQGGHVGDGSIYGQESVMGFPVVPYAGSRMRNSMSDMGAKIFHQALNSVGTVAAPGFPGYATSVGGYARSQAGSISGTIPYHSGGYGSQIFNNGTGHHGEGYELRAPTPGPAQNPFDSRTQSRQSLGGQSMPSISARAGELSNEQLENDIASILARSDLHTLTKKGVREELERVSVATLF